jgi:Inheritance of peroxisomes protein 1
MSKSVCWCVDGETKFVLPLRGGEFYYRIELPNTSEADKQAANKLKSVFSCVLRYETTACPFKRGFYVELPEQVEVIYKPWTPKHSPITARQQQGEAAAPPDFAPRLRRMGNLEVQKIRDRNSVIENLEDVQRMAGPDICESPHSGSSEEEESGTAHVEAVVFNYETLKSPDMLTPLTERESQNPPPHVQGWMHATVNEENIPFQGLQSPSDDSPKHLAGNWNSAVQDSSSGSEDEARDDYPKPPSTPEGEGSISTIDETQETPERYKIADPAPLLLDKVDPPTGRLGRSFTAPVSYQVNTALDTLSTERDRDKEALDTLIEVEPATSFSHEIESAPEMEELRPPNDFIPEFGVEEQPANSKSELQQIQADENLEEEIPITPIYSESRPSTPEWLGLSPEKSAFPPSVTDPINEPAQDFAAANELPTSDLENQDDERESESQTRSEESVEQLSAGLVASANAPAVEEATAELPSVEASPSSQLRQRFHQRRLKSSASPPPGPASSPSNTPHGNLAVWLLQSAYSLLLVPIIPVVAFVLTFMTRVKHGLPKAEGPIDLKRESQVPCAWESDVSVDENSSIQSEDDDRASSEGDSGQKTH